MRLSSQRIVARRFAQASRRETHMTLPGRAKTHRANPCATGIDRNSRRWRGRNRRFGMPCRCRARARGIRKRAARTRSTRRRGRARTASAHRRRCAPYVPSRNACAYSTTVERRSAAENRMRCRRVVATRPDRPPRPDRLRPARPLIASSRYWRSVPKTLSPERNVSEHGKVSFGRQWVRLAPWNGDVDGSERAAHAQRAVHAKRF